MSEKLKRPISLLKLFTYIFFFILLTLHGPYIFLITRQDLILQPGGGLEYDMGGIFPHLGAAMLAVSIQGGLSILIFLVVSILRYFIKTLNSFLVSFLGILGLQGVIYYDIYLSGNTKPEILAAFGPFSISWLLLGAFFLASVAKIYFDARSNIEIQTDFVEEQAE